MPQRALVSEPGRGARRDRGVEERLQPIPAAQLARRADAGGVSRPLRSLLGASVAHWTAAPGPWQWAGTAIMSATQMGGRSPGSPARRFLQKVNISRTPWGD